MKSKMLKTSFWLLGLCLAMGFTVVSCDDDDDDNTPTNVVRYQNLTLTGANERPQPNTSPNTGTINATFNKDTKVLSYTITWTGFTATNMHFHKGDANTGGPPVLPILAPWTSPQTGTFTLTADQETDLLAGLYYINVHSAAYPGGEIRAQMIGN